jgi:hypothetical protein
MQKIQEIPWFRIGAESIAIVGSILFAFAIDAWWEGRQENQREQRQLQALIAEFDGNLDFLSSDLDFFRERSSNLEEVRAQLTSVGEGEVVEIGGHLMPSFQFARITDPSTGMLDATISSGELGLLRDDTLRASLSEWSALIVEIQVDQQAVRDITNHQLIPYLGSLGDVSSFIRLSGARTTDTATLRSTGGLRITVANKLFYLELATRKLESLVGQTEDVIELLRSNLE